MSQKRVSTSALTLSTTETVVNAEDILVVKTSSEPSLTNVFMRSMGKSGDVAKTNEDAAPSDDESGLSFGDAPNNNDHNKTQIKGYESGDY